MIDGVDVLLSVPERCTAAAGGPGRIDLIQCYDEYVMGYSTSRHYPGRQRLRALPAVAGEPMHVVLRDGRMVGSGGTPCVRGRCELDIRLDPVTDPGEPVGKAVAAYGKLPWGCRPFW